MLQAGRLRVRFLMRSLDFTIDLILPEALGFDWASNRNEYQESPWGQRATGAQVWQPHRHLWADCLENEGTSTSHNLTGLHGLLQWWPDHSNHLHICSSGPEDMAVLSLSGSRIGRGGIKQQTDYAWCLHLYWVSSAVMKTEAKPSSEELVNFYQTTSRHIPEAECYVHSYLTMRESSNYGPRGNALPLYRSVQNWEL
jgi:hypothetical protein